MFVHSIPHSFIHSFIPKLSLSCENKKELGKKEAEKREREDDNRATERNQKETKIIKKQNN